VVEETEGQGRRRRRETDLSLKRKKGFSYRKSFSCWPFPFVVDT